MTAVADFTSLSLERLQDDDWRACCASVPCVFSDVESGEIREVWAVWRPLAAIEKHAWGLAADRLARVGVLTFAECAASMYWTQERYLVRLPPTMRAPQTAGQCVTLGAILPPEHRIELTPGAVERLRLQVRSAAGAGA